MHPLRGGVAISRTSQPEVGSREGSTCAIRRTPALPSDDAPFGKSQKDNRLVSIRFRHARCLLPP
jgi:hypothetical protein